MLFQAVVALHSPDSKLSVLLVEAVGAEVEGVEVLFPSS